MALQTALANSSAPVSAAWAARLRGSLVGCARTLWGVAVGLLFLLAFPLAIVLAPLLWAFGRLRGEADDHGSEDSLL